MARNIGVNFDGKHIIHPGAHSKVNADGLNALGQAGATHLALIGTSDGGEPGVVHWFDNPSDAKEVLRGGDLYKAGELAWTPSGDGTGAGSIAFLRVGDAKKSSLKKDGMLIESLDWGAHTNKIQVKLEDGAVANSKQITFYYWPDNITETYDNIGPIFNVKYDGAAETATLNVIGDETGKAKQLIISLDGSDVMVYQLGDGEYADINKIVYDINEHADFEASMVTVGNKNLVSDQLDVVSNVDIKGKQHTVTALKGDLIYQTRYSTLCSIKFDANGVVPENFDFTYMTGGSDGQVPASWTKEINKFYGEGVKIIVPLTGDEAIHAEVARFVNNQSQEEGSKMIGVYGGRLNETIDDVIGRALTFNSSRAVVCTPGITRPINGSTEKETLPPYFTAAQVAGRIAGKETGEPITLDYLSLVGLERVYTSTEIDRLIAAGVTVVEFVRHANKKGYRIAQGVTTYQADSNPSYREISMRLVTDELSEELVANLEDSFAGGKGTRTTLALIKNEVQSFLDQKKRDEVIVDYDAESVQVTLDGDKVYVGYSVIPVGAINYILITTKYYQEQLIAE